MPLVQSTHGRAASGAVALPFGSNNTLHNLLIAFVALESDTATVTSIVNSAGGTWVAAAPIKSSGVSSISGQIYFLADCPGGANTVTATPSAGACDLEIHEYSGGYDLTSPLGQHNEATGTSVTSASSNNITTTTPNELLFGAIASNRGITAGSGWTIRESDAFNLFNVTEDQVAATVNTFAATGTLASAGTYVACIATFKLAGGGGGGGTTGRNLTILGVS